MKKVYLISFILFIILLILMSFVNIPSPSKLINEEFLLEIK